LETRRRWKVEETGVGGEEGMESRSREKAKWRIPSP